MDQANKMDRIPIRPNNNEVFWTILCRTANSQQLKPKCGSLFYHIRPQQAQVQVTAVGEQKGNPDRKTKTKGEQNTYYKVSFLVRYNETMFKFYFIKELSSNQWNIILLCFTTTFINFNLKNFSAKSSQQHPLSKPTFLCNTDWLTNNYELSHMYNVTLIIITGQIKSNLNKPVQVSNSQALG